jgi:hypothetical protein
MHYQIYTMFVNRKDLLIRALAGLGEHRKETVILDNSPQQDLMLEDFPGEILRPCVPLYCNQSYNLIVSLARQRRQEVFFMMHSDALASPEVIAQMLDMADGLNKTGCNWGVLFTNYDVLCLWNTRVIQGFTWDPYLPLYYTDVDCYYRLKLAGVELIETYLSVEHQEGGSTTQRADPALRAFVETSYPAWRDYYIRKWGGERGQERFTAPFNGS